VKRDLIVIASHY
jgi:hypothetical protein